MVGLYLNSDETTFYSACFAFGIGLFAGYKLKMPFKVAVNIIFKEPTKLALIVREDLKMGKGKIVAQCCHGTLLSYMKISQVNPALCLQWEYCGSPKIVLKVKSLQEIKNIQNEANNLGVVNSIVCDAGLTQVAAGSETVLVLGPDKISNVNKLTGHLKLL